MSFDFRSDTPIFLQIIEHIKMKIISGQYLPNDRLASVRELSLNFGVNPNTVQKAVSQLEEIGLILTDSTNGKYITEDIVVIKKVRDETIKRIIDDFGDKIHEIGLSREDILEILKKEWL
ncbi:MAG: GntR family transcriptional regulator [Clostridia bacterium]